MNRFCIAAFCFSITAASLAQDKGDESLPDAGKCQEYPSPPLLEDRQRTGAESGAIDIDHPELGYFQPDMNAVDRDKAGQEACADDIPGTIDAEKDKPLGTELDCAVPRDLTVTAGMRDNYALPEDPANLTAEIIAFAGNFPASPWVGFDANQYNRRFGHQFQLSFTSNEGYRSGKLTLYLRPIGERFDNDTLTLWATPPTGPRRGWGTTMAATGLRLQQGRESVLELDLRLLQTGSSSILDDISRFKTLNVFFEDDIAIDAMTLTLSCTDSGLSGGPLVGVIPDDKGCGGYPTYEVFLDNEDRWNRNSRGGWIGATDSGQNTLFRFCGVPGDTFIPAAEAGARFALIAFTQSCPRGFTRFDRFHDNEDNRPASRDSAPSGSPTATVGPKRDTNMAFCVATGNNRNAANRNFPIFGFPYGVFGARKDIDPAPAWVIPASPADYRGSRGWVYLDDEDRNNRNRPANPPDYTWDFVQVGRNTEYYVARVK